MRNNTDKLLASIRSATRLAATLRQVDLEPPGELALARLVHAQVVKALELSDELVAELVAELEPNADAGRMDAVLRAYDGFLPSSTVEPGAPVPQTSEHDADAA